MAATQALTAGTVSRFIREHSRPRSVVQLSENDALFELAAFGERQPYVLHCAVNSGAPGPEVVRRFGQVATLLDQTSPEAARAEARSLGIEWLVVSEPARVHWAGEAHGYQVYRTE